MFAVCPRECVCNCVRAEHRLNKQQKLNLQQREGERKRESNAAACGRSQNPNQNQLAPQGPLPVVLASVRVSFFGLHSGHTHISPSLSPGPQHYATNDVKTRFASFRFIASPTDSVSFFLLSRHASSSCCCCCCCTTVVAFLNASHSFIENGQQSNNNSNNSNNNAISFIFAQKSSQKANVKINKAKSKEIKFQIRAATSNQQKQQRRKLSKSSSSAAKKSKLPRCMCVCDVSSIIVPYN